MQPQCQVHHRNSSQRHHSHSIDTLRGNTATIPARYTSNTQTCAHTCMFVVVVVVQFWEKKFRREGTKRLLLANGLLLATGLRASGHGVESQSHLQLQAPEMVPNMVQHSSITHLKSRFRCKALSCRGTCVCVCVRVRVCWTTTYTYQDRCINTYICGYFFSCVWNATRILNTTDL